MRRIFLVCAFFCFFILLTVPNAIAATASGLKAEAISNLQKAVVKALPTEGAIIRIAVMDLAGDDGTIKNAITSIIAEKTTFKIIERADLDQILKEQGLQLKDVMDEKTRIQHGKIKGVQGLLMGSVLGMESGFMSFTIRAHLKLDDVEKGEIVFAKDFNVTAVSPMKKWVFIIAGLVIVILLVVILLGRRRTVVKEAAIRKDVHTRVDLGREIVKVMATLSEARAKLMNRGKTETAVHLKEAERNLLALKEQIENAPRGATDMRETKDFKEALSFDKAFAENVEKLAKSAQKLYDVAASGAGDMEPRLDEVNRDIRAATDAFRGRKI
jgi:curli biogenesis system outer membrane secretion channel CsgG